MSIAYLDNSVLTASPSTNQERRLMRRLDEFACLISSNLLEAELRAALRL